MQEASPDTRKKGANQEPDQQTPQSSQQFGQSDATPSS